ncbi:arginine--tRNA ligase [Clostridia bacterium]|nr:arginine--tRNA ligase [Clostridia bacterium]
MDFRVKVAEKLREIITEIGFDEINQMIEIPPDSLLGDFAFPCFKLAKVLRKPPAVIAGEIVSGFAPCETVERAAQVGAYVNFFLNRELVAKTVIREILEQQEEYGKSGIGGGATVLIDYSSPNIAKPFHVGHIPTTVIGHALYNIYKHLGYNTISINHLGDWGTQFGKLITAYKNWGNEEEVEQGGVAELMRLYIRFHDEADKDASLNDTAREWLVKMQNGEEEAIALWKWFNDISLYEYKNNTYKRLGIDFDYYTGESFYNDKMSAVSDELREKGLLTLSEGASIVDLSAYNMPPCLILRSDGGTLYPTRDIAAAFYRQKTYNFDKVLYVTCMDQSLHFAQWFKVIELMGYDWASKLVHVPLGLINFSEGKLSTRKGNVILLDDVLNDAVSKTRGIIEEKNPNLADKDEIAESVGVGAVVFNNLYNSRIKDVSFSWERVLSFEGESGPYVQYTHARACSILKKADFTPKDSVDYSVLSDEIPSDVIRALSAFPRKILEVSETNEPCVLSRGLIEICQSFNKFYNSQTVLTDDENIRNARLTLVYCVKTVLALGLKLLGIKSPENM